VYRGQLYTYVVCRSVLCNVCLRADDISNCVAKLICAAEGKFLDGTANACSQESDDEQHAHSELLGKDIPSIPSSVVLRWYYKYHYDSNAGETGVATRDRSASELCQVQSHDYTNHSTGSRSHVQKCGLVGSETKTGNNRRACTHVSCRNPIQEIG
jgi:hypothetical protein